MDLWRRAARRQCSRAIASLAAIGDVCFLLTFSEICSAVASDPQLMSSNLSDGRTFKRRAPREVLASSARTKKVGRNPHMLESTAHAHSDDSSASNPDDADRTPSPPLDEGVVYSFDAARAPSQGSQIFTSALAKAVERFEDRETNQLVRNEYDVLNSEGETVGLTSGGKTKGTESAMRPLSAPDTDEEYEFV